jgi:flagellar basal body rod protein FlgG
MITRLRLALSLSSIKRFFGDGAVTPPPVADGDDIFAILTQSGEFVITQNSEVIIRQLADKNIIIMQDGFQLLQQDGDVMLLNQDYLRTQSDDATGARQTLVTQSGEEMIIG